MLVSARWVFAGIGCTDRMAPAPEGFQPQLAALARPLIHAPGLYLLLALLVSSAGLRAQAGRPPDSRPPGTAPGLSRTFTIQGRVVPAPGESQLPELMTVTLSTFSGGVIQTRLVRSGIFEFKGVGQGRYLVRLECEGFQSVEESLDLLQRPGAGMEFLQLSMGARLRSGPEVPPPGTTTVAANFLAAPVKAQKELEKAQRASQQQRFQQAVRHLEKALRIHPDFPEAYNNLAVQYLRLDRPEEALAALTRSLQLRPTAEAYQNLGILRMNQGRNQESAEALWQAHQMDPSDEQTIKVFGELYFRAGQYEKALQWFDALPETGEPMLALARGHCHLRLGRYSAALQQFEAFLLLDPKSPTATETRRLVEEIRKKLP